MGTANVKTKMATEAMLSPAPAAPPVTLTQEVNYGDAEGDNEAKRQKKPKPISMMESLPCKHRYRRRELRPQRSVHRSSAWSKLGRGAVSALQVRKARLGIAWPRAGRRPRNNS